MITQDEKIRAIRADLAKQLGEYNKFIREARQSGADKRDRFKNHINQRYAELVAGGRV